MMGSDSQTGSVRRHLGHGLVLILADQHEVELDLGLGTRGAGDDDVTVVQGEGQHVGLGETRGLHGAADTVLDGLSL